MLVRLMPEQTAKFWEQIKYAIENSMPPIVRGTMNMNKVLYSLESGRMVAWASVDNGKIVAIVTTTIMEDTCTDMKNLLIYSVYGIADQIGKKNWTDGYETLMKYAKAQGCMQMVAFSRVEAIKRIAKHFGADVDNTLIAIQVI